MGVEARVCLPRLTSRLAGSHRRALDVGRDFIWDLPMTLLLNISNIHRHRGRAFHLFNSIQLGYALMLWILRCAADALRAMLPDD